MSSSVEVQMDVVSSTVNSGDETTETNSPPDTAHTNSPPALSPAVPIGQALYYKETMFIVEVGKYQSTAY